MSDAVQRRRLMLVDDHALVRAGVRMLLERDGGFEVVAEAAHGREAIDRLADRPVDLVIMDITMPQLDGIDATRHLRSAFPSMPILMLSMHSSQIHVRRALDAGASGYCLKESGHDDLLNGVRAVLRGETYITPALSHAMAADGAALDKYTAGLTGRQRQILELIALGDTSKEIGKRLGISIKTVESHRTALMRFLGIHDLAGLVRYAIRIGLVSASDESRAQAAAAAAAASSGSSDNGPTAQN